MCHAGARFDTYANHRRHTRLRVHNHQEQRRCGCGGALVWAPVWANHIVCSTRAYGFDLASHLSLELSHPVTRPRFSVWHREDPTLSSRRIREACHGLLTSFGHSWGVLLRSATTHVSMKTSAFCLWKRSHAARAPVRQQQSDRIHRHRHLPSHIRWRSLGGR